MAVLIPLGFLLPQIDMYGSKGTSRWYMVTAWSFCMLLPVGASRLNSQWLRAIAGLALVAILTVTLWQETIPTLRDHPTYSADLAKTIWQAHENQFILKPEIADSESASAWRYLTHLLKGKPGTFVAYGNNILHWLPQKTKQGIRASGDPIPYPDTTIHHLTQKKSRHILSAMSVRHGFLHYNCNDWSKRTFLLIEKPYYLSDSFLCAFSPVFRVARDARRSGIALDEASVVVGVYSDGEWRYTQQVQYDSLFHPE